MLPWRRLTENRIKWRRFSQTMDAEGWTAVHLTGCLLPDEKLRNQTKQMGDDAEDAQHSSD